MKRRLLWALLVALLGWVSHVALGAVATTRHNLSVSGPGTVKATAESEICIFCHTPHNAAATGPLWNRNNPGSTYTLYTSSTARANPGQPTGASILCLSCHDGTVALGQVRSRTTQIGMTSTFMPTGPGRLGTDLSDDHPVSFTYSQSLVTQNPELVNPASLTGRVRLDASGQLQCTACHDAHDDTNGKFLVISNRAGALCTTCHNKNYWTSSTHRTSTRVWNNSGTDPWPFTTWTNVADNACQNCHKPHAAGRHPQLLNYVIEEQNCSACHNANVATKNVTSEFNKTSIHPIGTSSGTHDPGEAVIVNSRHVECADCHNPHAANATTGTVPGPILGTRGVNLAGTETRPITAEYQICFRCHADSTGKPASRTTRIVNETNTRLEFQTTNASYHPIGGAGRSTFVPSLIAPWTVSSIMKCTDCHNNNAGPGAGGTGPKGPHGSNFVPLLERQYITLDNTSESTTNYDLCYKCHSRTVLLSNASAFPLHNKHVSGERAPCNACHDPHGVRSTNTTNHARLINFDTNIVRPVTGVANTPRWESLGQATGRCYLSCHNEVHNPCSYGTGMGGGGGMCGMGGGGGGGGM